MTDVVPFFAIVRVANEDDQTDPENWRIMRVTSYSTDLGNEPHNVSGLYVPENFAVTRLVEDVLYCTFTYATAHQAVVSARAKYREYAGRIQGHLNKLQSCISERNQHVQRAATMDRLNLRDAILLEPTPEENDDA